MILRVYVALRSPALTSMGTNVRPVDTGWGVDGSPMVTGRSHTETTASGVLPATVTVKHSVVEGTWTT